MGECQRRIEKIAKGDQVLPGSIRQFRKVPNGTGVFFYCKCGWNQGTHQLIDIWIVRGWSSLKRTIVPPALLWAAKVTAGTNRRVWRTDADSKSFWLHQLCAFPTAQEIRRPRLLINNSTVRTLRRHVKIMY